MERSKSLNDLKFIKNEKIVNSKSLLNLNFKTSLSWFKNNKLKKSESLVMLSKNKKIVFKDDHSTKKRISNCFTDIIMKFEKYRLKSFINWDNTNVNKKDLAKAGFYYLLKRDYVKCFCCEIILFNWQKDEIPILSHYENSPRCEFLSGYDVGNHKIDRSPIEILQDYIEFKEFKATKHKEAQPYDVEKFLAKTNLCKDEQIKNDTISYIMKREEQRLKSFENWPLTYIKKEDLAMCGFYYTTNEDKVICAFCKVKVYHWEETDIPIKEHLKHNKNCPLLRDEDVGNIPIKKIQFKELLKEFEDVPIGFYLDDDIPPVNYEQSQEVFIRRIYGY